MIVRWRGIAAAFALVLCCGPFAFAGNDADRAALEAAAQAWVKAFQSRSIDALSALATEDIVLMDPALATFRGKRAARDAWQQAFRITGTDRVTVETREIAVEGDVAWRRATVLRHDAQGNTANKGQALEIWKRDRGVWKLHRQMSSAVLTPPQLLPLPEPEPLQDR
jgi:ketosteroid isomerase-like protein